MDTPPLPPISRPIRARLPIVVHEANARPGLGNRLGARYTDFVGMTFAGTRLRGGRLVGLPLRREIEILDRAATRADAYRELGLDARFPTLLVTGGSTGAARINAGISAAVAAILGAGWQVLHLTGSRSPVEDPGLPGYHILEYSDRMDLALSAAELAVSRAGAATVCELAAVGLPAVFVPYPVGNGEQELNARGAVDIGGALLVPDADFDARWVESTLVSLLDDRALVADMAARIAGIGVRDGADRLVDLILEARDSAPQGRRLRRASPLSMRSFQAPTISSKTASSFWRRRSGYILTAASATRRGFRRRPAARRRSGARSPSCEARAAWC